MLKAFASASGTVGVLFVHNFFLSEHGFFNWPLRPVFVSGLTIMAKQSVPRENQGAFRTA